MQVELEDGSLRYVNPRVSDTHRAVMALSEMNDMGHDVFFPRSDRGIKAYAYLEGSGTKLKLEGANGVLELPVEFCSTQSEQFEEQQLRYVLFTFGARTDRGYDGQDCEGRAPKLTGACSAACPTEGGRFRLQEADSWKKDQSSQEGERGHHERRSLQRQLEGDSFQGPVVKAKKAPSASSLDEFAAGHDRTSPMLVGKFLKDRWLVTHPVPCRGTQHRWIVGKRRERPHHERCANPGGEVRSGGVDH